MLEQLKVTAAADQIEHLTAAYAKGAVTREAYDRVLPILEVGESWGVTGSTFRAFGGIQSPSGIFRKWAKARFDMRNVTTDAAVAEAYSGADASLAQQWRTAAGAPLEPYKVRKLVDLYFKRVAQSFPVNSASRLLFERLGRVALDQYSLRKIGDCCPGLVMSREPKMGDVQTDGAYGFLQEVIGSLAAAAHVPKMFFDYWAWNAARG